MSAAMAEYTQGCNKGPPQVQAGTTRSREVFELKGFERRNVAHDWPLLGQLSPALLSAPSPHGRSPGLILLGQGDNMAPLNPRRRVLACKQQSVC